MTTRILLAYHSDEGQTAKIALRISARLRELDAFVDIAAAEEAPSPEDYDGVIVGDSIHVHHHSRELRKWLTEHQGALASMPVALFQVSLTSSKHDDESDHEANQMVGELLSETGLDPDLVGLFAGALAYTRYGWLKRHLVRRIAASRGQDTDMSVDHEYTDWEAVEEFTNDAHTIIIGGAETHVA